MKKEAVIKEVFEIAMHSIRNEEIFLRQDAMDRYMKDIKEPQTSALAAMSYEAEIQRAARSIAQRRKWLYELMDEFYKED